MSGVDDLRTAIAKAVHDSVDGWVGDELTIRRECAANADAVMAVLADPALREAILSGPMNLEVREGSVWAESWNWSPSFLPQPGREGWQTAYLVRPREEEETNGA